MDMPFFSLRSRARRRNARGQSMVEFALIAPVLVAFVFGVISFWLNYQKAATYTSASQTLAEWIARDGQFNSTMSDSIQTMLSESIGVDPSETYLTIVILDADNNPVASAGETVPSTGGGTAPGDTGWSDTIGDVVAGDFIQVDIWSYHTIGAGSLGVALQLVPDGHAVLRSMWVSP